MPPKIEQDIEPERRRPFLEARAQALRDQYVTEQANLEVAEDSLAQRIAEIEDNAAAAKAAAQADHSREVEDRKASLQRLSDAYDRVAQRVDALPPASDAPTAP